MRAFGDYTRRENYRLIVHKLTDVGCHSDNYIRNDISAYNVVRTAVLINAAQEVGDVARHVLKSRILYILSCHLNGDGVDIVSLALLCAEPSKSTTNRTL